MNIEVKIQTLLKEIGPGRMSSTAYDTAWVARLGNIDRELSNLSLGWICENQLPDGSWGAKDVFYYHDRVICTLSAMLAINQRGRRAYDKTQMEKGLMALEKITSGATSGLAADPNGATVGFELIVPTLVAEAEKLGIIKQKGDRILGRLTGLRKIKLNKLAGLKINRYITPAFSCEMAGVDQISLLDIDNLQETNGSVGNSPAASAYFASIVRPGDEKAVTYLRNIVRADGSMPFAAPFDIFERAWAIWNLTLLGNQDKEIETLCQHHLAYLRDLWDEEHGVSYSETYTPRDGDDTSITYSVLKQFGIPVNIKTVLNYEEANCFRCYPLESNSSISVNIHVLDALKRAGIDDKEHPSVKKIINYLKNSRISKAYWLDKWNTSPFYPTAHAVIAAHSYDFEMCEQAVNWILERQNATGSWGSLVTTATAEETAYCIQALKVWENVGGKVRQGCIDHAVSWLENHSEPPYPPLWIGKVLYSPENVVKSTILSALELARR